MLHVMEIFYFAQLTNGFSINYLKYERNAAKNSNYFQELFLCPNFCPTLYIHIEQMKPFSDSEDLILCKSDENSASKPFTEYSISINLLQSDNGSHNRSTIYIFIRSSYIVAIRLKQIFHFRMLVSILKSHKLLPPLSLFGHL